MSQIFLQTIIQITIFLFFFILWCLISKNKVKHTIIKLITITLITITVAFIYNILSYDNESLLVWLNTNSNYVYVWAYIFLSTLFWVTIFIIYKLIKFVYKKLVLKKLNKYNNIISSNSDKNQ